MDCSLDRVLSPVSLTRHSVIYIQQTISMVCSEPTQPYREILLGVSQMNFEKSIFVRYNTKNQTFSYFSVNFNLKKNLSMGLVVTYNVMSLLNRFQIVYGDNCSITVTTI